MGLLDDAIREHLDLKRRRGADPTEIERAEREALGPVRRGPELAGDGPDVAGEDLTPQPAAEPDAVPPETSEEWEPFDEDPELETLEEHEQLPPHEPARAPAGDPLIEDEPFADEPRAAASPPAPDISPAPDTSPGPESEPSRSPHPAEPPKAPAGARPDEAPAGQLDQETEEYDVEADEEANDDVLETTPEFLQDAPEHDRLWFEQRPPRDFDFDG